MNSSIIIPDDIQVDSRVVAKIQEFLQKFRPYEVEMGSRLVLLSDRKSKAYYLTCHLYGENLVLHYDLEATLDAEDDEIYKLNRDVYEDVGAYVNMEEDALHGRSFEDLVVEYDTSYNSKKPLKVYGGQHRIRAIEAANQQGISEIHGVRVFFNLSREQKVEIATVSNTSIAVPNDLLDRMQEQLIGSELRDWCQSVGLLEKGEDFSARKSPDTPSVRIARTLIVNFYRGRDASESEFHQPILCKSGGMDNDYRETRAKIDWSDKALITMGKEFARLHQLQREAVLNRDTDNYAEFARKALSLAVVAGWGYAAGFFQRNPEYLQNHYALPDSVSPPDDPLNAKALSEARLKGTDHDTYRGLGTRSSPSELGRMFEVFLVQASKASRRGITRQLANAAIQSYVAKKATYDADKVLRKI